MANQESHVPNAYESTLAASMSALATSFQVVAAGAVVPLTYLVLDPDDPVKRENVLVGQVAGTTFSSVSRYLAGSAAGSGITHDAGAVVRSVAVQQMWEDLHDRADAIAAALTAHTHTDAVLKSLADAKGDLLVAPAADSFARLGVGADGTILMAAAAESLGQKWQAHDATIHLAGTQLGAAVPGASAPGDVADEGVATTVARSDHRHGREAGVVGRTPTPLVTTQTVSGSAAVDITDTSVTVTMAAGRLYRLTSLAPILFNRTVGGISNPLLLQLTNAAGFIFGTNGTGPFDGTWSASLSVGLVICRIMEAPVVGSNTFKLQAIPNNGTWTINGSLANPVGILVEDIGPA
jgi:hypothetical protein